MRKIDNIIKWTIVSIFVGLYGLVSIISTIHTIDFFGMSNNSTMATTLAIAFEVGAAACLGAIVILDKTSRWLVWTLFILITGMQMMGNAYYAYSHLHDFQNWVDLFGISEQEPIFQKRILSIVSGAILPIVALGFIKSLVDYIRPSVKEEIVKLEQKEDHLESNQEDIEDIKPQSKGVERKIAKAIQNNPELKDKINQEIKKLDVEDKYTKSEEPVVQPKQEPSYKFGAM